MKKLHLCITIDTECDKGKIGKLSNHYPLEILIMVC